MGEARAAERNLRLVTDARRHAGIDYFPVAGRSVQRFVVGVRLTDRKALLGALRELYAGTALYVAEPTSGNWRGRTSERGRRGRWRLGLGPFARCGR
ncbi:hypothetical protein [Streptomyces sp. SID5785]|uniref:hypothetical protein n=1 Tax=Streptomyces sp. SID5785 TaxID=2690309 RepID=UPI001F182EC2|nr:hypothetical protein [Streptomyces sp. SID5785]